MKLRILHLSEALIAPLAYVWMCVVVASYMPFQGTNLVESLITCPTYVWSLIRVRASVSQKCRCMTKGLSTYAAREWALTSVDTLMTFQLVTAFELSATSCTQKWECIDMIKFMFFEGSLPRKCSTTRGTLKRCLTSMCPNVALENIQLTEWPCTVHTHMHFGLHMGFCLIHSVIYNGAVITFPVSFSLCHMCCLSLIHFLSGRSCWYLVALASATKKGNL